MSVKVYGLLLMFAGSHISKKANLLKSRDAKLPV